MVNSQAKKERYEKLMEATCGDVRVDALAEIISKETKSSVMIDLQGLEELNDLTENEYYIITDGDKKLVPINYNEPMSSVEETITDEIIRQTKEMDKYLAANPHYENKLLTLIAIIANMYLLDECSATLKCSTDKRIIEKANKAIAEMQADFGLNMSEHDQLIMDNVETLFSKL